MEYAVVHNVSMAIVERHEASSADECREKILKAHPEYECDTVSEMIQRYPVLMSSLLLIPLH